MSSLDSIMPPAAPEPAPAPAHANGEASAAAAPVAPAAHASADDVKVEGNAAEGLAAKPAPDAPATTNGAAPATLSPLTIGGEAASEPVALGASSGAGAASSDVAMSDPVPALDAGTASGATSSSFDMPEPAAFVASAAPAASSPVASASSPPVGANGDATPAVKRQRKSVAPFELDPTAPTSPSVASLAPASAVGMTAAQLKFAQSVIKSLRSRNEAQFFLEPVDIHALGIPHYPNIIKQPMDFATISLKLSFSSAALSRRPTEVIRKAASYKLDAARDVYGSAKEWEEDVRRIFSNCRLFNGPDHVVSQSANTLEALFDGQLSKLPPSETAPASSASVPTIRRSSVDTTGRPKREVHPPPSRDLPWSDMPGAGGAGVSTGGRKASVSKRKGKTMTPRQRAHAERVSADELKYASKVVSALMREKGAREFTWVFDSLPDNSLDFAPAYYEMIKRPIALDIIDGKLKQGDYNDLGEFEADMKLLFANCFQFNPPGSDVYVMGERTRDLFRERMKKMPKAKEMSPEAEDDEDEDALGEDDDEDADDRAAELKRQIAALKAELDATEKAGKTASKGSTKALASAKASLASTAGSKGGKKRAASDAVGSSPAAKKKAPAQKKAKASGSGTQAAASAAEEPKQPKAHKKKAAPKKSGGGAGGEEEEVRVVTYHQKEELAAKITQLPDERLEGALRIIAEDKPQTSADDEEIELDIDDLSPRTLYRLYRYVVKPKVKKAPTGKAAADGRKRGTGGVKRKNLDEGEEAARIQKLQEQLMQFDNAEAGGSALPAASAQAGAHDDHVESSSEEESESESESEYE